MDKKGFSFPEMNRYAPELNNINVNIPDTIMPALTGLALGLFFGNDKDPNLVRSISKNLFMTAGAVTIGLNISKIADQNMKEQIPALYYVFHSGEPFAISLAIGLITATTYKVARSRH